MPGRVPPGTGCLASKGCVVNWPSVSFVSRQSLVRAAVVIGCLSAASVASADLVFLKTGRSMSVKAVRYDGEQAVMTLRMGGEVIFDKASIDRVEPDEVEYPEPTPEPDPNAVPAAAPAGPQLDARAVAETPLPPPVIPAQFNGLVNELSKRHGVDARLVHAVITVESAYQTRARSPKGAKGLMQLMPDTARQYGVRNAYNATANLEAGIKHLKSLLDRFELKLALAAYNAGEATVRRFGGIPPYRETRDYVTKVMRLAGRR
jgi:membrane-bound lytic murein transglycosylase B